MSVISIADSKDIHDVYSELLPVARRWKYIGLALQLHIDELSNIEAKQNSTLDDHLLDMVTLYLSKPVAKGWQKIVEAARNPAGGKDTTLAQTIETRKGIYCYCSSSLHQACIKPLIPVSK